MRFFVEKITDIGRAHTLSFAADELNSLLGGSSEGLQSPFVGDVEVTFRISRVARRVLVAGDIMGSFVLQCSRCLSPTMGNFQEPFTLVLNIVDGEETIIEELELDDDSINNIQPVDGEIDLSPVLLEQVFMLLPTNPLCRVECSGLCPHCGIDRNFETCTCEPKPFNNRFGKLKDIKVDRT